MLLYYRTHLWWKRLQLANFAAIRMLSVAAKWRAIFLPHATKLLQCKTAFTFSVITGNIGKQFLWLFQYWCFIKSNTKYQLSICKKSTGRPVETNFCVLLQPFAEAKPAVIQIFINVYKLASPERFIRGAPTPTATGYIHILTRWRSRFSIVSKCLLL